MLGKTLKDRYRIIKHLGGGGFGQTYVAENSQLPGKPLCVVKQLKPKSNDAETLKTARLLFEREAQALYKLGHHEQIPQLLANFEEDEQFYLVQEFIEGNELKQELPIGNSLPETQVIKLLQDILEVLEFVHQQGVIHRDIKPSNLIRRKHDGKIVLIDFGAVKQVSAQIAHLEGQTTLTVAVGSPGYMPNEQLGGKPRFCSDIYAVGMLGIQALTGVPASQLPEDPRTSEIIWRDRLSSEKATSPLVDVLDKMVRYDYRQRYQTVTEARQSLTSLAHANLLKQSDTSATYTLRERFTSPQAILTTTQLSQTSLSQKQKIKNILGEPSASRTDSPEHTPSVTVSHKKSRRLVEIGTGIATGIALTLGISYFPSSNSLLAGGKNISLTNTLNSLFTGSEKIALTNTLTGHSKQVYAVVISPDGQTLVSGSVDNTIKLWNLSTGKLLHTLYGHSSKVKSIAITPDSQKIASGSGDGTIKLWNLKTGQLLRTFSGHSAVILSVAITPDGQTLVSSSADKTIKLWNLQTGKLLHTLSGHSSWVYSVAISPDGKILANGSDDRIIQLWHLPTGTLINTISDPSGNVVRSVVFSPDGQTLASGSFNAINLWKLGNLLSGCKNAQVCRPTHTLSGNLGIVESVAISPNNQTLATGSKDKTIKLWNLQTGKLKSTTSHLSDTIDSLTFSPNGKTLVSGGSEDGIIQIWRSP